MKYTPRQPPEGINTTIEHPLKEFAYLLGGLGMLIATTIVVLSLSVDYLVEFIPPSAEVKLFRVESDAAPNDADNNAEEQRVLAYLAERVTHINSVAEQPQAIVVDIVNSADANAFVLPGGRVFVTTGLLKLLDTENGLTMVLAHEWAHQQLRHPIKGLGKGLIITAALAVITGTQDNAWLSNVLGGAVNVGMLAFSREQERDADTLGLALTTRVYGHSTGADEFFAKMMSNDSALDIRAFLRTHPPTDARLARIEQQSPHRDHQAATPLPHFIKAYAAAAF